MNVLHVVQGGIENGDLDWLKQAMPKTVSTPWVVPKMARVGDSVVIYVQTYGFIATAQVASVPKPRTDRPNRYGARLTAFRLLRPPIDLDAIRRELPEFKWTRYPRSITTPEPSVAARIWKEVQMRLRHPHPVSRATEDVESDIASAEPDLSQVEATTRAALIQARMGQGIFREKLLSYWKASCALSGCRVIAALRASHIKPWRHSSNEERLDPFNGLLLVGTADLLFDAGLISFSDKGQILFGSEIPLSERRILGLRAGVRLRHLHRKHLPYLKWHREHVFVGTA